MRLKHGGRCTLQCPAIAFIYLYVHCNLFFHKMGFVRKKNWWCPKKIFRNLQNDTSLRIRIKSNSLPIFPTCPDHLRNTSLLVDKWGTSSWICLRVKGLHYSALYSVQTHTFNTFRDLVGLDAITTVMNRLCFFYRILDLCLRFNKRSSKSCAFKTPQF